MTDNIWFVATIWMGLAFVASLISIRLGISVALVEIFVGIFAGNFLGILVNDLTCEQVLPSMLNSCSQS